MPLCFIEPQDAIRVIAESIGREARRQLVGELVRAWVDEIPDGELEHQYAKAIADLDEPPGGEPDHQCARAIAALDEHALSMPPAWHASLGVAQPIANRDFLINAF